MDLTIRCVLERPPCHVWFVEAPGAQVPSVASEAVLCTLAPLEAVLWALYSCEERLKWDRSPFVAHRSVFAGGVRQRAFRDVVYSRVRIGRGVSDRELLQERFLMKLPAGKLGSQRWL